MKHYICTGDCAGESDKNGVCQTEGCSKEGEAFIECDCEDGLHTGVAATFEDRDAFEVDEDDYE